MYNKLYNKLDAKFVSNNARKDKYVFHAKEVGKYTICAKFLKTWKYPELPKNVLLGLKISLNFY